ncbi:MAG: hypothetical protein ACM3Q9_01990 [Methanosarcina sp.]
MPYLRRRSAACLPGRLSTCEADQLNLDLDDHDGEATHAAGGAGCWQERQGSGGLSAKADVDWLARGGDAAVNDDVIPAPGLLKYDARILVGDYDVARASIDRNVLPLVASKVGADRLHLSFDGIGTSVDN